MHDVYGNLCNEYILKNHDTGLHSYTFNLSNYQQGIYFYTLSTAKFTQTKK